MDWKDTVITDIPQGTEPQTTSCRHCAYLRTQAEISFKAGEEYERGLNHEWAFLHEKGKKAGIKEAVEWVNLHGFKEADIITFNRDRWQAKLKELGIETQP